jgi:hypothetical protein
VALRSTKARLARPVPIFERGHVTGISTGAVTAPFAFLGPAYDARLKEIYTTLSAKDVMQPRGYLAVMLEDAVSDNTPLPRTIARYVDQAVVDAIEGGTSL